MSEGKLNEKWSAKYKRSINCASPKGFSQRAHCAGRRKDESAPNTRYILYLNGKAAAHYSTEKEARSQAALVKAAHPNTKIDIKPITQGLLESLHDWFKEKWVRFGPDGKIRGACARGSESEGKPKCLPQSKAHSLGKKGRATAAARKRRQDPNPERSGKAINVATKKESVTEKKDACYNKVKSRYKVWPSAYASGALVQCRKRGASNWGKK